MQYKTDDHHYITGFIIGEKGVFDMRKSINEIYFLKKFKKTTTLLDAKYNHFMKCIYYS